MNNSRTLNLGFTHLIVAVALIIAISARGYSQDVIPGKALIRFMPGTSIGAMNEVLNYIGNGALMEHYLMPEYTLTIKYSRLNQLIYNEKDQRIIRAEDPLLRTYLFKFDNLENPIKLSESLIRKFPQVEIAEPIYRNIAFALPNDEYASNQIAMFTSGIYDLWDYAGWTGDTNTIIGISDTGIWQDHEDIAPNLSINWNEIPNNNIDDDANGLVDDFNGYNVAYRDDLTKPGNTYHFDDHGTNVAGIAAAMTNNDLGIAGVAYKCKLFPIKAAPANDDGIDYGYPSIISAVHRGVKVLNCSWGVRKPPSVIDQSVIDYAIANDLAIVASAGNFGTDQPVYPSCYLGVLGVGEVNQIDGKVSGSSFGRNARIFAQGEGNWTTVSGGGYKGVSGGTSFSAPLVAGALALVRSKYPMLSPEQAIEYLRQMNDDIVDANQSIKKLISGRLNMRKAPVTEPFSIPGVSPRAFHYTNLDGASNVRFKSGELVKLDISAFNHLGAADWLTFDLSIAKDGGNSIELNPDKKSTTIENIAQESPLNISGFEFTIGNATSNYTIFRIDITGDGGYKDFFLFNFIPNSGLSDFENSKLLIALSDNGKIGYRGASPSRIGSGLQLKGHGSQIFKGGFMASANNSVVVSSNFGNGSDDNDFAVVKGYTDGEQNIAVFDDRYAFEEIGIEVSQTIGFADEISNTGYLLLKIKNISGNDINDLSVGYYLDFDIGADDYWNVTKNRIDYFIESIPEWASTKAGSQVASSYVDGYPQFALAVASDESNVQPQSAGLTYATTSNFSEDEQLQALNSGNFIQSSELTDISTVVGMKFKGATAPSQVRECYFCFGGNSDKMALAEDIKQCLRLLTTDVVDSGNFQNNDIALFPIPASESISIRGNLIGIENLGIFDLLGNRLMTCKVLDPTFMTIPIDNLQAGTYYIRDLSNPSIHLKFLVID